MKINYTTFLLVASGMFFSTFARDIYVAKDGNDSNPGTITQPYLTINKAASEAIAGDVVYIREGVYEEILTPTRSGSAGNPIVYTGYQSEKVVISAMEKVSGFTLDSGSIYKKTLNWDLGQRMFLLHDNTLMDLARWPNNVDGNRFTIESRRNDGGSGSGATGFLTDSEIPNLPWQNGGTLFFFGDRSGSGWLTWRLPITASSSGRVDYRSTFDVGFILDFHPPSDKGDFYLEGIKEAIDYQNEWFFNSTTKELFVQIPGGGVPANGSIQVSRRENAINFNSKNFIEIRNLAVLGGSIIMSGNDNKLFQVSSFYGGMTRGSDAKGFSTGVASVKIPWKNPQWKNNVIEKCEIAFADGSGINVVGNNTLIKDNYIHDCGYLGNYDAPILARDGNATNILNNTIRGSGRDGVQTINRNSEIAWNDISESSKIVHDCAAFYTINTDKFMKIHHNWCHDVEARGNLNKAAGIYLDNDATEVDVYNNLVWNVEWTGVQMNWNIKNVNVYNNTLVKTSGGAMGAWHRSGTAFSNVKVWNNIADVETLDNPNTQEDEGTFERDSDRQNNIITQVGFVDYTGNNFELTASSPAVDAGRQIPGFTDGFSGAAPDAGAYEFGVPAWKPGISWDINTGPNNVCYGLPGETCSAPPPPTMTSTSFVTPTISELENDQISFTVNMDYSTISAGQVVFVELRNPNNTFLANDNVEPANPTSVTNVPFTINIPENSRPLPNGTYPLLTFIRTPDGNGGFTYGGGETIQIEVVSPSLSTEEFKKPSRLRIFTNPVKKAITFDYEKVLGEEYFVYSITGQLLKTGICGGKINVEALNDGIFFLKVKNSTAKFIKE